MRTFQKGQRLFDIEWEETDGLVTNMILAGIQKENKKVALFPSFVHQSKVESYRTLYSLCLDKKGERSWLCKMCPTKLSLMLNFRDS